MTTRRPTIRTDRYFTCPHGCADKFYVEHLFMDARSTHRAGPWYCDTCGQGWMLRVVGDGAVEVDAWDGGSNQGHDGRKRHCLATLEIEPQREPIVLTVRGMYFTPSLNAEEIEHRRYFYEEHTCPSNYMRSVVSVRLGAHEDPHGLARLVGVESVAADWPRVRTESDLQRLVAADPTFAAAVLGLDHECVRECWAGVSVPRGMTVEEALRAWGRCGSGK